MSSRGSQRGVKRHDNLTGQKKRRQEKLLRQKTLRQDAAMRARALVEGHSEQGASAAAGPPATTAGAEAQAAHQPDASPDLLAGVGAGTGAGAAGGIGSADAGAGAGRRRRARKRPAVDLYVSELMVPEWMVGVPDDLASQWFVIPRRKYTSILATDTHSAWTRC